MKREYINLLKLKQNNKCFSPYEKEEIIPTNNKILIFKRSNKTISINISEKRIEKLEFLIHTAQLASMELNKEIDNMSKT